MVELEAEVEGGKTLEGIEFIRSVMLRCQLSVMWYHSGASPCNSLAKVRIKPKICFSLDRPWGRMGKDLMNGEKSFGGS